MKQDVVKVTYTCGRVERIYATVGRGEYIAELYRQRLGVEIARVVEDELTEA